MDRLTNPNEKFKVDCKVSQCYIVMKYYDRLAAYEDTGYTPEEIKALQSALGNGYSEYEEKCKEIASLKAENERLHSMLDSIQPLYEERMEH